MSSRPGTVDPVVDRVDPRAIVDARAPAPSHPSLVARLLLTLLSGYQRWLSPALGPRCRFWPTCSAYAGQAVRERGAGRGSWLAACRLVRCHPFHPGGHDPVPPARCPVATMSALPTSSLSTPALGRRPADEHLSPPVTRSTPRRTGADPC